MTAVEKKEPSEKEKVEGDKKSRAEHKETKKEKTNINACKNLNGIHQSPTAKTMGKPTKIVNKYTI